MVGRRQLFRAGLKHILNGDLFRVTAEVDDIAGARSAASACRILIVDKPDDLAAIESGVGSIKSAFPSTRVVVLAEAMDADHLVQCFLAGVDGYLLADIAPAALCESLRLVEMGEKVFSSRLVLLLTTQQRRSGADVSLSASSGQGHLSDREGEIVTRLAAGMANKVIANELAITEATVKVHLKSILKKLRVANRTQAAIWAVNNGYGAIARPAA